MQSLESIPSWFSDFMNISLEAAQAILSIIVILAILLPILYLAKGRNIVVLVVLMFVLTEGALVGIGWLPFWLFLVNITAIAMSIAFLGRNFVQGGG